MQNYERYNFIFDCESVRAGKKSFLSLRCLVITLNQRAPEARVVRLGGWVGGDVKGHTISLNFR